MEEEEEAKKRRRREKEREREEDGKEEGRVVEMLHGERTKRMVWVRRRQNEERGEGEKGRGGREEQQ